MSFSGLQHKSWAFSVASRRCPSVCHKHIAVRSLIAASQTCSTYDDIRCLLSGVRVNIVLSHLVVGQQSDSTLSFVEHRSSAELTACVYTMCQPRATPSLEMHHLFFTGGRRHVRLCFRSETMHSPHGPTVETKQRKLDFRTSPAMILSLKVKPYSVQRIYFRGSTLRMICARFDGLFICFRIIKFDYVRPPPT